MESLFNEIVEEESIWYPKIMPVQNIMVGGLVGYQDVDDGTYLLKKETLERMLPSLIEKPLIIDHQEITTDNIEEVSKGSVIDVWFNADTGQFDGKVIVTDKEAYELIKNGNNKVSSAYRVTKFGNGDRYCGIEYDAEILDGVFTHLAIVDNPRYPEAKILINNLNLKDKGDNCMFFKLNKLNEEEVKEQKVNEGDKIVIDDEEVELKDLIDAYKNSCKKNEDEAEKENEDEKQAEDEKDNACKKNEEDDEKENEDADDELITKIRKVVKEMLEAEKANKKNEDEDKGNEEEKKNKISDYPKSNSLRVASQSSEPEKFEYKTRAERIAESNKKYSL